MLNIPWRLFEKTGNVETYLLMKQLETKHTNQSDPSSSHNRLMNEPK